MLKCLALWKLKLLKHTLEMQHVYLVMCGTYNGMQLVVLTQGIKYGWDGERIVGMHRYYVITINVFMLQWLLGEDTHSV